MNRKARTRHRPRRLIARTVLALLTAALVSTQRVRTQATIQVDTTTPGIVADGSCSLQEAIHAANVDAAFNGCVAGNGDDVIELQAGATYRMSAPVDDPDNPLGPTATPVVLTTITIEAHGAQIVRSNPNGTTTGLPNFRAFAVLGDLTIHNAHIKGFAIKGGNGGTGGGGGLGAGGAIYVAGGSLVVENSTFESNRAVGGNGTFQVDTAGGGGGGLSGNGGSGDFSGGGGGGSRGDGGAGRFEHGGGGGGRVTSGNGSTPGQPCGGTGGENTEGFGSDGGDPGSCAGGGGGGSTEAQAVIDPICGDDGGAGNYGGGGGGGGRDGDGGLGGFGGGGGANGGDGGFGGGGGAGETCPAAHTGQGGTFAGDGRSNGGAGGGGGGAGLGGAIFGHAATITIVNSTFAGNSVLHGFAAGNANNGRGAGGAIFLVAGSLIVLNSTLNDNQTDEWTNTTEGITGLGGGAIVVYKPTTGDATSFTLRNTILANNGPFECYTRNGVSVSPSTSTHNIITDNNPNTAGDQPCVGVVSPEDPHLATLALNPPGNTKTMAISNTSSAFDAGDPATCETYDQRGVFRPFYAPCDIGAFELATQADVSVTKTAASPLVAGGDVTYNITARNAGPIDAAAVQLNDPVPAGATFKSLTSPSGWTCTKPAVGAAGSISCSKPSLAVNAADAFTLVVHLPSSTGDGTQVCNTASISTTTSDPQTANNSATACGTVTTRADLSVTQTSSTTGRAGKGTATFILTVRNNGPSDSQNVALLATSSLFIGPPPATVTASPNATCTVAESTVSCRWTSLAAGASDIVRIDVPWKSAVGQVCDTATVSAGTVDPNAINNSSSACIGKK